MTTSMLASDNLDSIALLERASAPSSYFKEGFGMNIAKKLISELTCCIGCGEKGSDRCKWTCAREKESNRYKWVRIKECV